MTLDFLIEIGWKSAIIAALALASVALLRGAPARDRVILLRTALAIILFLPVAALFAPALRFEILEQLPPPTAGPFAEGVAPSFDARAWVLAVYAIGAALLLLRLVLGVATLETWTRASTPVRDPVWTRALNHAARGAPATRLRHSDGAIAPISWGWPRSTILVDSATLQRTEDAEAIIAHECAHARHGDWLGLLLGRVTVALFWFNPLMWLVQRAATEFAEQAADQSATHVVEPRQYAQVLLNCASTRKAHGANAMAAGVLTRRINAVLAPRAGRRGALLAVAIALCAGVAAPLSATEFAHRQAARAPGAIALVPTSVDLAAAAPVPTATQPTRTEPSRLAQGSSARAESWSLGEDDRVLVERDAELAANERQLAENERELARRERASGNEDGAAAADQRATNADGRALAADGRILAVRGRAFAEEGRLVHAQWRASGDAEAERARTASERWRAQSETLADD